MGDYLRTPNIFKYATSELSQDAFICWVLDGLNYPNTEINSFSKAFINLILKGALNQVHKMCSFQSDDVTGVEIERQKGKIDIFATLEIDNGKGYETLIIEDKTFTTQHDDQLYRYKQANKDKGPICIYYKIGYDYNDRIIANANGYAFIGINDIMDLMKSFENRFSSDIFTSYYECITDLKSENNRIERAVQKNLDKHVGQFTMMNRLLHPTNEIVIKKADYINNQPPIIIDRIELGQNIGGAPWTQYTLLYQEDSEYVAKG